MCVCVSEGEIRQVNLLRLQRAHVFILLPQVTKKGTDSPCFSVCVDSCFSVDSKDVQLSFCECLVRLVQEDITLRRAVL